MSEKMRAVPVGPTTILPEKSGAAVRRLAPMDAGGTCT